jgi:hypothetical protein
MHSDLEYGTLPHPTDQQLVWLHDQELPRAEAAKVQQHLAGCWECQARWSKISDAVTAFVDFNDQLFASEHSKPLRNWCDFDVALEGAVNEESRKQDGSWAGGFLASILHGYRLFERGRLALGPGTQNWLRPAAVLVTFTIIVGAAILFSPRNATVSAHELLVQSRVSDEAVLSDPGQVVHRTVTVEVREDGSAKPVLKRKVETWQQKSKVARRVFTERGKLIAGTWVKDSSGTRVIYQNGKLRSAAATRNNPLSDDEIWQLTPSAEDFAEVTGRNGKLTVEEHPTVYVLRYENGPSASRPRLVSASLTLRRGDIHAIEQTLRVEENGGIRDYRYVEAAYERQAVDENIVRDFDVDPSLEHNLEPKAEPSLTTPALVTATAELEVEVLQRLDSVSALLQNQASLQRTPEGTLLVQGVVPNEERKNELNRALAGFKHNPAVRVAISTPEEAEHRQGRTRSTPLQVQSVEIAVDEGQTNPDLRHYFATNRGLSKEQIDREVQRFSFNVLDHLAEAQRHVLALKEIVDPFSGSDLDSMAPQAREQWKTMVAAHAQGARRELMIVHDQLAPVFRPVSVPAPGASEPTDLRHTVDQISEIVAATDRVLWSALATTADETASAQAKSAAFWAALEKAQQLAADLRPD